MSQDVCPWNVRFARALPEASPFAPREALSGKDARALARELLGMSRADFGAAFKGSPMKRARLRGLKCNAAVVLGNAGERRRLLAATVDVVPARRVLTPAAADWQTAGDALNALGGGEAMKGRSF